MQAIFPSRIQVPIAPGAPKMARERVAAWSALFSDDALPSRLSILLPALARLGFSPGDRQHAPIVHSLGWGTAIEVTMRLFSDGLSEDEMILLDALATSVRITSGLAARRGRTASQLATIFSQVSDGLLSRIDGAEDLRCDWQSALATYGTTEDNGCWSDEDISVVSRNQPLYVSMACLSLTAVRGHPWLVQSARDYSALVWLATDCNQATLSEKSSKLRGPVGDMTNGSGMTSPEELRSLLRRQTSLMNGVALALHEGLSKHAADAPSEVQEYTTTTLRYAGTVLRRLQLRNLV
jgi:hypothetical protein